MRTTRTSGDLRLYRILLILDLPTIPQTATQLAGSRLAAPQSVLNAAAIEFGCSGMITIGGGGRSGKSLAPHTPVASATNCAGMFVAT